jgi:hypothetical protein
MASSRNRPIGKLEIRRRFAMLKKLLPFGVLLILAAAAVLVTPSAGQAQRYFPGYDVYQPYPYYYYQPYPYSSFQQPFYGYPTYYYRPYYSYYDYWYPRYGAYPRYGFGLRAYRWR